MTDINKTKKLVGYLLATTGFNENSIQTTWDGQRWVAFIDLPNMGKFGVASSLGKTESLNEALDHALAFIDEYMKEHPDFKLNNDLDNLDFTLDETSPDHYSLHIVTK